MTTPALVDLAAQHDLAKMQRLLRDIRHDTAALADPKRRSATIAGIPAELWDDTDDDAGLDAIFASVDPAVGPRRGAGQRRRR